MADLMKKRTIFVIMTVLLAISLIPLFLTVLTSVIPEGDLFHIITGKNLLDFESKAVFLKTKMKPMGNKAYEIKDKTDAGGKYYSVKNVSAGEKTGIAVFLGDKDVNLIRKIEFDFRTTDRNSEVYFGLKDVDGKERIAGVHKGNMSDEWGRMEIEFESFEFEGIDLKHISQLQILFSSESPDSVFELDNIDIKYNFPTFMNFVNVWEENDFARYMLNSAFISVFVVIGNLILSSMVAYALARKNFRGREIIFSVILATMMIPPQITIIPIFMMMEKIGWINTYLALIVPALVSPFGIFLMRQYIEQLPSELDQAAYVDGANDFQIFFRIILPLSGPGLAVLGINSFISSWNALYYPLVLTNSKEMRTVQVGLALFSKLNQVQWPKLMAASTLVGLPVIIIFLIFQRQIISGLVDGAVKS